jgi:hypothetical protein
MSIPTKPGFYWVKLCIRDERTADEDVFKPKNNWEVVDVFENCINQSDPEHFRIHEVAAVKSLTLMVRRRPGPTASDGELL